MSTHEHHCHSAPDAPLFGRRSWIVLAAFAALLAASYLPFELIRPLNTALIEYLHLIWWAVLLGFAIGGVIEHFVPDDLVFRFLGGQRKRSIPYAVLAGFIMSACSHGILAIAMQLYRKGAGVPAVITFLMASPWANLPMTILLFGFFGWQALVFVLGAMLIALITGYAFMLLDRLGWIEGPLDVSGEGRSSEVPSGTLRQHAEGVTRGAVSLADMVLWWILIGVTLASVFQAYLPEGFMQEYMGPDLMGLAITLAVATVIEICSEGSSPLAFEIYRSTGALGNPFVFLMAGVATDYTEIGLIWSNIGRRAALWLPAIAVPQILVAAWSINLYA